MTHQPGKFIISLTIAFIILWIGLLMSPQSVFAAADTCTWTGANSGFWADGGNWAGCDNGNVPESGDSLIFPNGAANTTNTNNIAGLDLVDISFASAYTIGGNLFTLTNGITSTTGNVIINNDMALAGNQTFQNTGNGFTLNGQINLNNFTLTINNTGTTETRMTNTVFGNGTIITAGASGLFLEGDNTYTGQTLINAGRIWITSGTALGASGVGNETIVAANTTISIIGSLTINEDISVSGSGNAGSGAIRFESGAGDTVLSGNITLIATTLIGSSAPHTLIISGVISGAIGSDLRLSKSGINGGPFRLTNNNTYAGGTLTGTNAQITDVTIDGNQPLSNVVMLNTLLRGSGTIGDLGVSGAVNDSHIFPDDDNVVGTLTTNNLTLNTDATYHVDIDGVNADAIVVNGTVSINNLNLNINAMSAPTANSYIIIDNDGADAAIGTFAGLPEDSQVVISGETYIITYVGGDGNDVALFRLPAPEISVSADATPIPDGGTFTFPAMTTVGNPMTQVITVTNVGTADLTISAPITVTGDFAVPNFVTTLIAPNTSATFDLVCNATQEGTATGSVSFRTTDGDESPFDFTVECTATLEPTDTPEPTDEPTDEPSPAVTPAPQLSLNITKSVNQSAVVSGDSVTFTINYSNPRGETVNATLTDQLDDRLTNLNVVSVSAGTALWSGNTLTVSDIVLLPGQSGFAVVSATVVGQAGDVILNTASLQGYTSNEVSVLVLPNVLPDTGETPIWRTPLLLAILGLLLGGVLWVRRQVVLR